jgi:membrane protease YdiL (CAAX protease family)
VAGAGAGEGGAPTGILALGPTSDGLRRAMVELAPWATFGTLEGLDRLATSAPIWVIVPLMALVPGFAEELLFRGMFQGSIRRPALAIFFSGLLFAAYHTDPHHVVAVLPLGFYLAWLRHRTGSTFVPITAHVVNNATAVIAVVVIGQDGAEEAPFEWWWMPVGWLVVAVIVAVIVRVTRPRLSPPAPAEF